MMDEENTDNFILQRIKRLLNKPKPTSSVNEYEIESQLKIEKLNGNFYYKSMKKLDADKYKAFVEKLQERLNLSKQSKDSLLDALDCGENEEKLDILWFSDGKGFIYRGWYLAVTKDTGIDIVYGIYTADFQLAKKETKSWAFNWWYFIPTGWKTEIQELTLKQKQELGEWCDLQLYKMSHKTFKESKS